MSVFTHRTVHGRNEPVSAKLTLPTSDVFALCDIIKYTITHAASQTAVQFKVPPGRALTQIGHSDAIMTSSENMTSQPNVLHGREWHL